LLIASLDEDSLDWLDGGSTGVKVFLYSNITEDNKLILLKPL